MRVRPAIDVVMIVAVAIMMAGCGRKEKVAPAAPERVRTAPVQPAVTGVGTIEGIVQFKGTPRTPKKINMSADEACLTIHSSETVDEKFGYKQHEDGTVTLGNVFVYLKGVPAGDYQQSSTPLVLDQKGCRYEPHVMGAVAGQEFLIKNSDSTTHNVHSLAKSNANFNNGQTWNAPALRKTFGHEEVMIKIKCDMHPWMTCYVGVLTHPFFDVTGTDGSFTLSDVPVGTYEIVAWHELLKTRTQTIIIATDRTAQVEFTFEKK